MGKTTEEAFELLEDKASNNYQWSNDRGMPKRAPGMYDIDGINMLNAKVDNLVKMFGKLGSVNSVSNSNAIVNGGWSGESHINSDCLQFEQAQFVTNFSRQQQQNNPYTNTYNPGWRNHLNISWREQGNQGSSSRPSPPRF